MRHGDGVKDIAFEVEDCVKLYHVSQALLCLIVACKSGLIV